jgi:hypothetical protein
MRAGASQFIGRLRPHQGIRRNSEGLLKRIAMLDDNSARPFNIQIIFGE